MEKKDEEKSDTKITDGERVDVEGRGMVEEIREMEINVT